MRGAEIVTRRRSILRMLVDHPEDSYTEIAQLLGCDPTVVRRLAVAEHLERGQVKKRLDGAVSCRYT